MRLNHLTLLSILAANSVVLAAPAKHEKDLTVRNEELLEILKSLDSYKSKRDEAGKELSAREYQIVTDVLSALNDTDLAPEIIHYFATNSFFQPIVVNVIVDVLKSGTIDITALFEALDESNLVVTVVQDLISDCSLYVSLFRTAENLISGLVDKVQDAINSLKKRELFESMNSFKSSRQLKTREQLETRETSQIVVNLLESLANSGLATSVVKSIITDSSYIPFAEDLIAQILAEDALSVSDLVDAIKNTNLASDLLKSILSVSTFDTVVTNAFAAYSGDCSGSSSSDSGSDSSSGSGSSDSSSGSSTADPCSKKRIRRRKRTVYNY